MIVTDEIELRKPSREINIKDDINIINLTIKELKRTLNDDCIKYRGIGISAIQIGVAIKVSIVKTKDLDLVLINPKIIDKGPAIIFKNEGCLSFPGVYANTLRYEDVTIENYDLEGNKQTLSFDGIEAVVIQHEIDHENGVVFFDNKLKPIKSEGKKVGRNDPCPYCLEKGKTIKFKKCGEHYAN